jgi:hypothetical protein
MGAAAETTTPGLVYSNENDPMLYRDIPRTVFLSYLYVTGFDIDADIQKFLLRLPVVAFTVTQNGLGQLDPWIAAVEADLIDDMNERIPLRSRRYRRSHENDGYAAGK